MTEPTPDTANNPKLGKRERHLLAEFVRVEEELLPDFVRPILLMIGIAVIAFLLWAGMTPLTEIAVASGEIAPAGAIKVVQHLDGGIVEAIQVKSRQPVKQGEVLLRLDGSKPLAELKQMQARQAALQLRSERLKAITESRVPDFTAFSQSHPDLVQDQQNIYTTQLATWKSSLEILSSQIEQRQRRLAQLRQNLDSAEKQLLLTSQLVAVREDLAEKRLIDLTTLIETRRSNLTAEEEVASLKQEIRLVEQELAEAQSRHQDTANQLQQDALKELGQARSEKAEVEESIIQLQSRVDRLEVRAPVDGFIHNIKVETIGQVVMPGELLMQVVPANAKLIARVQINPKDIGYVQPGQRVNVRVSSYDFTRYGMAKGVLDQVSASNLVNEDGTAYFQGTVSFDKPYLGDNPETNPLQVGMAVDADILTGEKTLLAYLLKPVVQSLSRAFSER
ncbi:MAG: HlyD family type I secretion periplasmic adaptor subunit [Gammaproteobacteria bacterium]|nr:HlyD family type I secretion periplasmic adaptor subunit [Gammaproteobacteria bacterium]